MIDDLDLFSKLKNLNEIFQEEAKALLEIHNFKQNSNWFPNAWATYVMLLTVAITVASEERSSLKWKLMKSIL